MGGGLSLNYKKYSFTLTKEEKERVSFFCEGKGASIVSKKYSFFILTKEEEEKEENIFTFFFSEGDPPPSKKKKKKIFSLNWRE